LLFEDFKGGHTVNDVETYLYDRINAILAEMAPLTKQLIEAASALRALDGDKTAAVPMARPASKKMGRPATTSLALMKIIRKSGALGISAAEAEAKLGLKVSGSLHHMKNNGILTHKDHRYYLNGASRG
jgi:hypothetical protein